ncbi:LysR family transcriptional regulator [Rhodoplanes sp. TEM]|uniref:LysR family transcriptional regulator n=1 Tax=Rhodoplanes tepidamans TaxID=200616 RepID=A0ABT5J683_RHOTP|nr:MULTISPECIES: LysR family transcriptional regulator [Rhodoplanes]MDC7785160.1 LysR family transcriptional regulator [Rhodoplanes tepidamans]MDC7982634.1 LysR family transcriptional regulator [Rhodoplanes sp. TEM]MDQ0356652.1 DNA-binding transcriptional LysR family regulator [Rhodoplanes tepidamans]
MHHVAMYLDLPGLDAFIAVADLGSFHRAAARLGISQPALTRRLQRLEQIVGRKLLVRRAQPVRLTPAGAALLPEAQAALGRLRDAMRRAGDTGRGHDIEVGCLPTLAVRYLAGALARHRQRWQGGEITVFDLSATEIRAMLEQNRLDFALAAIGSEPWDVECTPLAEEPFFLVCPRGHRLAGRASVSWDELDREPLVSIGPLSENRRIIEAGLAQTRVEASWRIEVRHLSTAVALVAAGAGLTALPESALAGQAASGVVAVPLRRPALTRTIGLMRRRDRMLSAAAQDLMEDILQAFGRTQPERSTSGPAGPSDEDTPDEDATAPAC